MRLLLVLVLFSVALDSAAQSACTPSAGWVLPGNYTFPARDTLSVVTWNVEHFVDGHDNPYIRNRMEDAADTSRVAAFVEAVRAMDADLLILQEIESKAFVQHLANTRFPEMGYRYFVGTESGDWYQNVVMLSRFPVGVTADYSQVYTVWEGETDAEGRTMAGRQTNHRVWLAEVLVTPERTMAVAGVHLKAGRTPRDVAWRTGQIRLLHREMERISAGCDEPLVMVAGDLNVLQDSQELRILREEGPFPMQPAVLDLTHPASNPTRQLDYILSSPALHRRTPAADVIRTLPGIDLTTFSDHLPVRARIVLAR